MDNLGVVFLIYIGYFFSSKVVKGLLLRFLIIFMSSSSINIIDN